MSRLLYMHISLKMIESIERLSVLRVELPIKMSTDLFLKTLPDSFP